MPIADALLGFHASFVMLILGAAGAWCIHGTLLTMSVHNLQELILLLGSIVLRHWLPKCLQGSVAVYGVQGCCSQHAFIVVVDWT